jgi:hypothetical protein
MTTEIDRIARGLTKAQARAVSNAVEDNGRWFIRSWSNPLLNQRDAKQMRKMGLGFQVWSGFCLGETGLAVRSHLLAKENGHDA